MSERFTDILLELRHFVSDEAEPHDPYEQSNQIISKIDNYLKEITK